MPVGCEKCVYSRLFTHKMLFESNFTNWLRHAISVVFTEDYKYDLTFTVKFYLCWHQFIDSTKLFDQSFQLTLEHFSMFEISFERFWIELNWILRTKSIKYIIYIISSLEWQRERRGYEIPGNLIDVRHNSMNPSLLERWQRILLEEK